jgi:hypothetical protein
MNTSTQNTSTQKSEGQPIRIFIGSSPKNTIEEAVFRHTLAKYSSQPLELYSIDGQAGSVTNLNTGEVKTVPPNVISRIKGATAFSLARWAIPQWCAYQGRAIYCDSDQVVLTDITELWNIDLAGAPLAAVPVRLAKSAAHYTDHFLQNYLKPGEKYHLASVMVMDCAQCQAWSLESLVELIDQQAFTMADLMYIGDRFCNYFGFTMQALPSDWNCLDCVNEAAKLVHFTDLTRQPWRFHHHPLAKFWEEIYLEAIAAGALTQNTVIEAYRQGWITARIKALGLRGRPAAAAIDPLWRRWSGLMQGIARFCQKQVSRVKFFGPRWARQLGLLPPQQA